MSDKSLFFLISICRGQTRIYIIDDRSERLMSYGIMSGYSWINSWIQYCCYVRVFQRTQFFSPIMHRGASLSDGCTTPVIEEVPDHPRHIRGGACHPDSAHLRLRWPFIFLKSSEIGAVLTINKNYNQSCTGTIDVTVTCMFHLLDNLTSSW